MTLPPDPRPTAELNNLEAWPFADGAAKVSVWVSRRDDAGKPSAYMAVVEFFEDVPQPKNPNAKRNPPKRVQSLGIRANPLSALDAAIKDFYRLQSQGDRSLGLDIEEMLG